MKNFTFDELVAKREQRKADKLKVSNITVPNTDRVLQVKQLTETQLMDIYGQFASAGGDFEPLIHCVDTALYHCCDQLQDPKLREALGVADPLDVVPALFSLQERNQMGEQLLQFLKILPELGDDAAREAENPAKN